MVVGIGKGHTITTSCNYLRHIHIHIHYNARKKLRNYETLKKKINMISKRFADISQIHFFFFFVFSPWMIWWDNWKGNRVSLFVLLILLESITTFLLDIYHGYRS